MMAVNAQRFHAGRANRRWLAGWCAISTLALLVTALGATPQPAPGRGSEVFEVVKLIASDGAAGDRLGYSTALSGDTAVAGTGQADAAYVFERDQGGESAWGETATLTASDGGTMGRWTAIDGDTIVVGGSDTVAAYVYERDQGGAGMWGEVALLVVPGVDFRSHPRVAISGDTIVVGAPRANANFGVAYVFERDQGGCQAHGARCRRG